MAVLEDPLDLLVAQVSLEHVLDPPPHLSLVAVHFGNSHNCSDWDVVTGEPGVNGVLQYCDLFGNGDVVDPGVVAVLLLQ